MALNATLRNTLATGLGTVRQNVQRLMTPTKNRTRMKAIMTIAKRNNISRTDAQFKQSVAIARGLARKPK